MDIINVLPEEKFNNIDDLLTFISIYDDKNRTRAFLQLLENHKNEIKDKVCLEIGTGLGILSEKAARLGAHKVYAIERNPYLFQLARQRLKKYPNVQLLNIDITEFQPKEEIDIVIQELFGQLLYDEDIYVLENLKFKPKLILPTEAKLKVGATYVAEFEDEVVNQSMIKFLNGVLVSGLFDEEGLELQKEVIDYKFNSPLKRQAIIDISDLKGDLIYFGLEIYDKGKRICQAGVCDNWSFIWTYRAGNKFELKFEPTSRGSEVFFRWIE